MASLIGAPRVLLRRLREIMAQHADPQESLDQIVTQIASNLVAEVSSIYVTRADGRLELFATEGLNQTRFTIHFWRKARASSVLSRHRRNRLISAMRNRIRPFLIVLRPVKIRFTPSSGFPCCAVAYGRRVDPAK